MVEVIGANVVDVVVVDVELVAVVVEVVVVLRGLNDGIDVVGTGTVFGQYVDG